MRESLANNDVIGGCNNGRDVSWLLKIFQSFRADRLGRASATLGDRLLLTLHKAGSRAGRSHHKSLPDKHFEEVVVVPACGEAFVFNPDLVGCFVLEHDQSGLAEGAEIDIRMSFADSGMILSKRYVQLPVELVLDRPVALCANDG